MSLIIELRTGKKLTKEELAIKLYKEGQHIIYCDIECIAKAIDEELYYLIDECGQYAWIDTERFKIVRGNIR